MPLRGSSRFPRKARRSSPRQKRECHLRKRKICEIGYKDSRPCLCRILQDVKIVIDTNMLVAYMFNKRSASADIIGLAEKGAIDIIWHGPIKSEAKLITGKITKAVPHAAIDLDSIFKPCNEVKEVPPISPVSEDPEDDKFLACAAAAGADMVISNDRHLLTLRKFRNIPIFNASTALKMIKESLATPPYGAV